MAGRSGTAGPEATAGLPPLVQQTLRKLGPLGVNIDALVRLLQQSGNDARGVVAAVQLCPTLTARVVSVVNSAAFGAPWRLVSPSYSVQVLGPKRVRSIALAYALRTMSRPSALPAQTVEAIGRAAIRKGLAARLFCEAVDPDHAEAAYTLGLIQDLGLTMLMAADPGFYHDPQVFSGSDGGAAAERAHFGLAHGAVGQELLLSWHASERMQQVILGHHRPPPDDADPVVHACFVAGLLPHTDEPISPEAHRLLERCHARFLHAHYETADAFLLAVAEQARRILEPRARPSSAERQAVMARLISAVTNEAINAQTRLCKMEQAYRGQRESFTNLREQAFTDALTRLLNRRGFLELADRRMQSEQTAGRGLCVMAFDLDGLKKLNDTHGHDVGDMLLRGFAKLLRRYLDEDDLIARFGGDEYAAMIANVDEATARRVAERIVGQLHRSRLRLRPDLEVDVSCSVGAIFYDRPALGPTDIENVLSQADHVMYQRKHGGKAGMAFQTYLPGAAIESGDSRVGQALAAQAVPAPGDSGVKGP